MGLALRAVRQDITVLLRYVLCVPLIAQHAILTPTAPTAQQITSFSTINASQPAPMATFQMLPTALSAIRSVPPALVPLLIAHPAQGPFSTTPLAILYALMALTTMDQPALSARLLALFAVVLRFALLAPPAISSTQTFATIPALTLLIPQQESASLALRLAPPVL